MGQETVREIRQVVDKPSVKPNDLNHFIWRHNIQHTSNVGNVS